MTLKSTFLAFKKSCTSCSNWGGGNLDKIQKNSSCFRDVIPNCSPPTPPPYTTKVLDFLRFVLEKIQYSFFLIVYSRGCYSTSCTLYCNILQLRHNTAGTICFDWCSEMYSAQPWPLRSCWPWKLLKVLLLQRLPAARGGNTEIWIRDGKFLPSQGIWDNFTTSFLRGRVICIKLKKRKHDTAYWKQTTSQTSHG